MDQTPLSAKNMPEMLDFLGRRRSSKVLALGGPGPAPDQVETILRLGARVPDHGKLAPWRFIVMQDDAQSRAGEFLKTAWPDEEPGASPAKIDLEGERFLRAPLVIAVISSPKESAKAPEWEQILSAGACCFNLCLAANAMGFASTWLTEWYTYNETFRNMMGLSKDERFAGFIYIGTAQKDPEERERPNLPDIVRYM